jgi:hypothetical protein
MALSRANEYWQALAVAALTRATRNTALVTATARSALS